MSDEYYDKNNDSWIITHYEDAYNKYFGAVVPPVFMNTFHVFDRTEEFSDDRKDEKDFFVYGRISNPTVKIVEDKIAALERGEEALCFSSGMAAATTALLSVCKANSHIICVRNCYGVLQAFINDYCVPMLGMSVTYVDGGEISGFEKAIRNETALIILESPSSSIFEVQDLRAVAALARDYGIITYTDNSFCTPVFQKPIEMGIDIVMHTASKYIGGHSDVLGGVLVFRDGEFGRSRAAKMREMLGCVPGPMDAWLMLRGLRTLDVRVRRHQETAAKVAEYLESHPKVAKVFYTGLKSHPQFDLICRQQQGSTGLLSFTLAKEYADEGKRFVDCLEVFKIGPSWGGYESLANLVHANVSPEKKRWHGIADGTIRLHCGLEGAGCLIEDLERAFEEIR